MRLDKFLKKNRIVKRRVIAHDLCVNGKVLKDNRKLKPGYDVKKEDLIEINFGKKSLTIKVIDDSNFEIVEEKFTEGD
jgi:ribosomal 50S subunit-recycling heat shock protein